MVTHPPSDVRVRLLRDYAASTFLQIAAAALLLFLILRVAAPWLVDLHSTAALVIAAALLLACPLVLIYAGWALWASRRRLKAKLAALPV
jgi:hypothetical protein